MSFTPTQKTLAILPKCTGFLSLMGSLFIFQDVVLHKRPITRVYYRIMFGLSCADMIASIVNIFSTWPMPPDSGAFLASGTTATCTAQGFFNELGNVATPLYNTSLCAYYVLVIREAWSEDRIRVQAEPYMHALPIFIALTFSIIGLPLTLYNNSGWLCWIAKNPKGCDGPECTRGKYSDIFRWVHYAIIWSAIILVTVGMYLIYLTVRKFDKREAEENNEEVARMARTKKVAIQSFLFCGAMYLTWSFTTIARIYDVITGHQSTALLVLMAIFFPLQGFFNFLVFCRPRYLRCKSRNAGLPTHKILWLALQPEDHTRNRGRATNDRQRPSAGREVNYRQGCADRLTTTSYNATQASNNRKYPHNTDRSYYAIQTSKNATDDDYSEINTVKAVADDSDFRRPDSEIEDQNDNRDAPDADEEGQRLDAVAEESDAHR